MSLTLTHKRSAVWGNKRARTYEVTFDDSYPTAGESLTASDVGLRVIEDVFPEGIASNSDGTGGTLGAPVRYDYSSAKLQAFESAADGDPLDETGSTNSLANYMVQVTFLGW